MPPPPANAPPHLLRTAVFLDRDDTLIRCNDITPDGDLGDPRLVELVPGVMDACQLLVHAGFTLAVVSNQGGVARGKYHLDAVEAVNARLNQLLGGLITAFRYCPYHPGGSVPAFAREHPWRKPAPGMLLDAAAQLGLDLPRSWMVGDKERDCQAGRAAGCRTILLREPAPPVGDPAIDFVAPDLAAAAAMIVREDARRAHMGTPSN